MRMSNAFRAVILSLTIATSLAGLPAPVAAAPTPGALIKRSDHPAVYYYGADAKRYVFPNERTFKTWYADFSGVQIVTAAEMAAVPVGGNVTYRPGSKMIKIDTDPKVYAISRGGVLRPLASESAAAAIYGANWAKQVHDIPDAFFTNYRMGAVIDSPDDYNRDAELAAAPTINADKALLASPAPEPEPEPDPAPAPDP